MPAAGLSLTRNEFTSLASVITNDAGAMNASSSRSTVTCAASRAAVTA